MRKAAALAVVDRHQEVGCQEEVRLGSIELVLGGVEVDAVQHDVEMLAVAFNLRVGFALHGGIDGQFVQTELVAHDRRISLGRLRHIRPHDDLAGLVLRSRGGGGQPSRVEAVHHFGATVPMDEVTNQSPTFTLKAACAAARRATGTRYGEQLT